MRDEEGLRELFGQEYAGLVRLSFLLCGNAHTAEEVVQEAFVRAAERWRRISSYDRPGAWLRLVVVRLSSRRRTGARRETGLASLPEAGSLDPPMRDPDLWQALRALDRTPRCCVVLHHLEDLPVREVAEALELPEGTVRSHLHRARQALARMLGEDFFGPVAGNGGSLPGSVAGGADVGSRAVGRECP